METIKIEDANQISEVGVSRFKTLRKCIFYKEEICTAPRIRFRLCKTCYRIDPQYFLANFLEKIKSMVRKMFNLPEKLLEPPLPG